MNINVKKIKPLMPPSCILEELPCTDDISTFITNSRKTVVNIINGSDKRLMVVTGPCSIHNVEEGLDYAKKLLELSNKYKGELYIVMRVYFEKPRTTVGWKGLINDPDLNNTYNINKGLRLARKFMLDINKLGLPVATEFLDTITPQYISDLVTWGAIGARTTESQLHRELVSGLSCPIGFKNGTNGDTQIAIDAMLSSTQPHTFLGVSTDGLASIVETRGNKNTHIILRGGRNSTNYEYSIVKDIISNMNKHDINAKVMIDFSHGNCQKNYKNQELVGDHVSRQVGINQGIIGVMIESNIVEGSQKLENSKELKYGQSITDGCIDLNTTDRIFNMLVDGVKQRMSQ